MGGWTITGIAKKCKDKRLYALRGGWKMIVIAKNCAKIRGFMD